MTNSRFAHLAVLAVLAVLALAVAARDAGAQSLASLAPNARIRVGTINGNVETGRLLAVRADSLVLRIAHVDTTAVYPIAGLRTYAVSRGTPRGRGARRGALISGALGLIAVGVSLHADVTTTDDIIIPSTVFVAPLAVVFTLLGTGAGALIVQEQWAAPEPLRVGVIHNAPRRLAVGYRVRF